MNVRSCVLGWIFNAYCGRSGLKSCSMRRQLHNQPLGRAQQVNTKIANKNTVNFFSFLFFLSFFKIVQTPQGPPLQLIFRTELYSFNLTSKLQSLFILFFSDIVLNYAQIRRVRILSFSVFALRLLFIFQLPQVNVHILCWSLLKMSRYGNVTITRLISRPSVKQG